MATAEELGHLAYAVGCAYDPNQAIQEQAGVDKQALQAQATAFCDQVRLSPHGWRITLELFSAPGCDTHSKFFALSALQGFLGGRRDSSAPVLTDAASRREVREGLFRWLRAMGAAVEGEEAFIRTKLAVVLALCLKTDYPEYWPTGFADLKAGLVGDGLGCPAWNTELYLRILCAVDEEIVAFHVDRTHEEIARNCLIKDTMRSAGVVGEICIAVREVVARYGEALEGSKGQLAVLALTTLTRFVVWIDMAHVTDEGFLGLLYECARSSPPLAEAAFGCLLEIVNKGSGAEGSAEDGTGDDGIGSKVELLLKLRALPLVEGAQAVVEADEDVAEAAAEVVNALGTTLLSCWDSAEEALQQTTPSSSTPTPTTTTPHDPRHVSAVAGMLGEACGYMLRFLSHSCCDVSSTVVPFATRLLDTVKRQQQYEERSQVVLDGGAAPFVGAAVVPQLLSVVFEQLHYSEDFSFEDSDNEEEAEEEVHRRAIRKVLLKATRVCPDLSLHFLCSVLSAQQAEGVALSSLPFPRAEALLRVVFHFGEGLGPKREDLVSSGAFPSILTALHASDICSHPHPMVVVLYLETAERYWRQLKASATEESSAGGDTGDDGSSSSAMVGAVMQRMCTALTSPHPTLRARAAFLLKSLVRRLGPQLMAPFAPAVLSGIREMLFGGEVGSSSDLNQLFELASLLLSHLNQEAQAQHMDALVAPVVATMHQLLTGTEQALPAAAVPERLAQNMSFLAMASKGSTRPQPHMDASYARVLHVSSSCLSRYPHHEAVRLKFMVVLHRMVAVLSRDELFRVLPDVLPVLVAPPQQHSHLAAAAAASSGDESGGLGSASVGGGNGGDDDDGNLRDLEAVAPLLNQLILHFTADLSLVLDSVVLPFLHRIVALSPVLPETSTVATSALPEGGGGGVGSTHVVAVAAALRRHYLVLLHHVTSQGLARVLTSPRNLPHLQGVLDMVLAALGDPSLDPVLAKTAVVTLTALANEWLPPYATAHATAVAERQQDGLALRGEEAAQLAASFTSFLIGKVAPVSLGMLLSPSFKPKDANSARVVGEVARLLWAVSVAAPDDALPRHLLTHALPALACPPHVAHTFVAAAFSQPQQQAVDGSVSAGGGAGGVEKALRALLSDR